MGPRRKPDYEAIAVHIEADRIEKPVYVPLRRKHGGSRTVARGDVEITVQKQHPGAKDKGKRPDAGTVLTTQGKDSEVTIEARGIEKKGSVKGNQGREAATARNRVEIFGKMRRKGQ